MNDQLFQILKKALPGVKKNVLLKNHTTFKIGGPAKYFLVAKKKEEISKALKLAKTLKIKTFILGGGSNILASDYGFDGLVIKIENKPGSLKLKNKTMIEAPVGVTMASLVSFAIKNSLEGLEWAGGLPGTFGGAIRGNAGCFGAETKDSIVEVLALDQDLILRKLTNKQCGFSYRNSLFKQKNWVVLSATVKLKKGDKKQLQKIANSHIAYRKERHPLDYPNAGSVFKNVDFKLIAPKFQKLFLDKVKKDPFLIVPTAWFIIEGGLTGKIIGKAQISKKHSNYIVNKGNAKANHVTAIIEFIKNHIKKIYNIELEEEVQFLE